MPQMTAVHVTRPGAPFEVVQRSIPEPAPDQVRIKVQACGVCHSDAFVKEGHWPGLEYPRALLCAGIATFNSLRHSGGVAGDLVAVQGLGGLGHLGIQFALKMGFRTVAIGRGKDKEQLAKDLGAHHYLDTDRVNVAEELTKQGGASVILATAPNGKAMSSLIDALGVDGTLLVVGASADPITVTPIQLIGKRRSIRVALRDRPRFRGDAQLLRAHGEYAQWSNDFHLNKPGLHTIA